jgi:hypothetical protein
MMFATKRALSVIAATAFLCASTVAHAGGPVGLTDGQLDGVTAGQGGPFAGVTAGATASGLFATGNTLTTAATGVGDSPFNGSDAYATGVAFGVGMNGVAPGTSSASVTTYSEAPGNFVVNYSNTTTIYGIGSTLQVGVSTSTGDLVPGLP